MPRRCAVPLAFVIAVLSTAGVCNRPATPAPATPESTPDAKKPKERLLKMQAPNGTVVYDDTTKTYVFTNVERIELPDSEAAMRADRIEWNREERWIRATGNPRLWDPNNELTAERIQADLKAKCATAEGSVRLVARPKEAKTEEGRKARQQIKEPVVVHCDRMEYFYKAKRGTAAGNLKLTQKDKRADRTATGERLTYDGNEEVVALEGSVHVSNTKGEGFQCKRVVVRMKEGAEGFQAEGIQDATFYFTEDEEEGAQPAAGQQPSSNPPAPPKQQ